MLISFTSRIRHHRMRYNKCKCYEYSYIMDITIPGNQNKIFIIQIRCRSGLHLIPFVDNNVGYTMYVYMRMCLCVCMYNFIMDTLTFSHTQFQCGIMK